MNQLDTLDLFQKYHCTDPKEQIFKTQTEDLVHTFPDFYDRNLLPGHLTGSAWIVNEATDKALLVHHRKLNQWMQPGGHAEPTDKSIYHTACRELEEETGIKITKKITAEIFDIDIHIFPARGDMPQHAHYDIRFCFVIAEDTALSISSESKDLQWFSLEQIKEMTQEESILRMVRKTAKL